MTQDKGHQVYQPHNIVHTKKKVQSWSSQNAPHAHSQQRQEALNLPIRAALLGRRNGAAMSKEEDLDSQAEAHMQGDDDSEQGLAGALIGGAEHRVEVPEQEGDTDAEADADEDPVQQVELRPGDEGHGDPDQVRVAVERQALEQVCGFRPEVFEGQEEQRWD